MPLSPSTEPKKMLHRRSIDVTGYLRADGLYEIEGNVLDKRGHDFSNPFRGAIPAGTAIHDLWIKLVVDRNLIVHDIEAVSDTTPYPTICPKITSQFKQLIGLQIGTGWSQRVSERVGGTKGCTHLVELLKPLATTAFMTIWVWEREQKSNPGESAGERPHFLDSCHALVTSGEPIRREYPQFYQAPPDPGDN